MNSTANSNSLFPPLGESDYDRFAPLVRRNAIRIANRFPRLVTVSELISVGWIGLLEAVDRARGTVPNDELEDFAVCRVRGAMFDHLRHLDPATRRGRRASRKLDETVREMTHALGRPPEDQELAERLGLDMDDYHQLVSRTQTPQTTSLDTAPAAQLGASSRGPDEVATVRLLLDKVAEAMTHLPERQQQLLQLMYQQGRSQKEAAEVLHVGPARVCQLHSEAIRRLQNELGAA